MKIERIYKFLIVILIVCGSLVCREQPGKNSLGNNLKIKGASIAHVHIRGKGYGSGASAPLYTHLKSIGFNSVQLVPFAYQRDLSEPHLFYDDPTMTWQDIENEIILAHTMGLTVMLKPHIWPGTDWQPKVFRDKIDFADPDKLNRWFLEYQKFLTPLVEIAIRQRVEYFVIGTELTALSRHTDHWRRLIAAIRNRGYSGALTYAAIAYNASYIQFWDQLDYIGLDFYYGTQDKNSDSVALQKKLRHYWQYHLEHAKRVKKEIILTEVGYPAHSLALAYPHTWPEKMSDRDDKKQADGFRALAETLNGSENPAGLYIWKYATTIDSYEKKDNENGFNPYRKPAEQNIGEIFRQMPN